ncbi:CpsB/CapC family capsule biosynthesis tyrosine phosphatase [Oribacterium sp. WCC10]|uniref:CpsB/CapC family capsule biosynthesis tyrosine phosphatase n=1 Tax=Oribacterium sp. WCC10 TaxID=1855343 RepID=UPI0008EE0291|nr:CpsB/CapC family capsule biosynthesis tyrosine phosphatase [Oribacterium sp. WCC10]SFG65453.1 protein-tyrosine phosphatase [Oribacterium sp. WCC10]
MFDIHSHIIYHIDDGARDIEESVELIRSDTRQGVTDIIATPHYYVQYPTDPKRINEKLLDIKQAVSKEGIEVNLYTGNEVLYFDSMTERLKSGEILTLCGSKYTLIEFYPLESYTTIMKCIRNVRQAGYRPVIAHAERFKGLQDNGLSEVISQGAYIQLSTEPLTRRGLGAMLDRETVFVRNALKKRQGHFLGTDMHRTDTRPPKVEGALNWIQKNLDPEYAEKVLSGNARRIVEDVEIN